MTRIAAALALAVSLLACDGPSSDADVRASCNAVADAIGEATGCPSRSDLEKLESDFHKECDVGMYPDVCREELIAWHLCYADSSWSCSAGSSTPKPSAPCSSEAEALFACRRSNPGDITPGAP
jgi:hypothetical protein